jgi:hypothetical protein
LCNLSGNTSTVFQCKIHFENFGHPANVSTVSAISMTGEERTGFWWGNQRETDCWGNLGVDGRLIFRGIFKE